MYRQRAPILEPARNSTRPQRPGKIGVPSVGHPTPPTLVGWQIGDEYGRKPTRLIGVPPAAPVIVHCAGAFTSGHGMFAPDPLELFM